MYNLEFRPIFRRFTSLGCNSPLNTLVGTLSWIGAAGENFGFYAEMVDYTELFMLPSSEFRLMALMKNIGGDDQQILGVYIYLRPPSFGTVVHKAHYYIRQHLICHVLICSYTVLKLQVLEIDSISILINIDIPISE